MVIQNPDYNIYEILPRSRRSHSTDSKKFICLHNSFNKQKSSRPSLDTPASKKHSLILRLILYFCVSALRVNIRVDAATLKSSLKTQQTGRVQFVSSVTTMGPSS